MSFHSWHATWHALQPMQRDTSMSFATSVLLRTVGGWSVEAERWTMSSEV